MTIYIHYETHPYHRVRTLQEHVAPDQYEIYLARRDVFVRAFAGVESTPFQVRTNSNQLASATVSLSESKVAEVQQEMQKLIEIAAAAIDQTLALESAY